VALAARDRGYDVHVATPRGRSDETIRGSGLPWHEIILGRGVHVVRDPLAVLQLVQLYRRLRPDLVHHIGMKTVLLGMLATRAARVPAIVNAIMGLGSAFDDHRPISRAVHFGLQHLLGHRRMRLTFENAEDRETFVRRKWIAPEQAVLIRGSGVDPLEFSPPPQPPADTPLVLFAARLLTTKGVPEFVAAARMLSARGIAARFAVAGEPDPKNPDSIPEAELARWRSEGVVEVLGYRSGMPDLMRSASLFVLPSYYREGVPKALMEAASTGLAVVTTDMPGCRDIVVDGETGLLVPPRDVDSLAAAIERLLADPERRNEMGRKGRQRMVEHFAVAHVARETLATYDALLTPR
jgi:glycosyltransferase involved in cell wall biosynthesis